MKRRDFLSATAGVAAGGLAMPRLSLAQDARVLRFVPQANLSSLDAIAGTQYVVRNAAMMVWDTLYGVNDRLEPRPQMAEGATASEDGLTWTVKLRPGLLFHDNEPVLPKDVIASLKRWMVRDSMGQIIAAQIGRAWTGRTIEPSVIHMNKPFSEDAVRGRQSQLANGADHAGAHCGDGPIQADHGVSWVPVR